MSSSSSSSSSSHSSTGSGGGGAARLEASEAMDRDLLNSFGDSIGGVDSYNNNLHSYNAMMNHMSHQQPMLGNMYDLMNSGQFGQYVGLGSLLPQGSMISPQGMPFTFPYPMPSPAQVAATAAAMAAQQHQQQQYSYQSQSGQESQHHFHLQPPISTGGKPTRGTKRGQKNTDGSSPMPPLNKRKVVALSTADRQDRHETNQSVTSSSNSNQDTDLADSSTAGKSTRTSGKEPRVSGLSPTASKERRRERNKVLARKTRMKKKEELETLRAQVAVLKAENDRLKGSMYRGSGSGSGSAKASMPSSQGQVLSGEYDSFHLPEKVHEIVEKMLSLAGMNENGKRSFCLCNPTAKDCPIVYSSPDFVELTGYDMHSILGHNCRFLQGPETDKHEVAKLKNAMVEGREETVVIKNYRKDGTTFWNRVQLSPIRDNNNHVILIVGLQSQVYRDPTSSFSASSSSPRKKPNSHGNGSGSGSGSTTGSSDGVSGMGSGSDGNNDSDRDHRRPKDNNNNNDDGTGDDDEENESQNESSDGDDDDDDNDDDNDGDDEADEDN